MGFGDGGTSSLTQVIVRIKAAKLEADADVLSGLAASWRRIGMSTRRHSANTVH
jgi:hypothetical protein